MIDHPKSFTVVDPRMLDGTVFEVADTAVAQIAALASLTKESIASARAMALNAEMERQLQAGMNADVDAFNDSAQGKIWDRIERQIGETHKDLLTLQRAAGFNPKQR